MNTNAATCSTIRANHQQPTASIDVSRLTFRSKFELILKQLSQFVQNYQRELENYREKGILDDKNNVAHDVDDDDEEDVDEAVVIVIDDVNNNGKIKNKTEPRNINQNLKGTELAKSLAEVNETLMNIEDDLHKILNLLMTQLELIIQRNSNGKQTNIDEDSLMEFHDYCQQNEIKFNRQLNKLKSEMESSKKLIGFSNSSSKRHYKVKPNDIHFILGTSPTMSHSIVAAKQMKLAKLKQHGPLCGRMPSDQASTHLRLETNPSLKKEPSTLFTADEKEMSSIEISKQIQAMIEQLQMEHDLIYRLLQKQLKKTDERSHIRIKMLFGHLVHIMNHIYDLHQLNTRCLLKR